MKLNPPKNLHYVQPRICAFCTFFRNVGSGWSYCARDPDDTDWDTGDGFYYMMVCDYYRSSFKHQGDKE